MPRTILDAATEITVAAITSGKLSSSIPAPNFQDNVTSFFSAVYKEIEQEETR